MKIETKKSINKSFKDHLFGIKSHILEKICCIIKIFLRSFSEITVTEQCFYEDCFIFSVPHSHWLVMVVKTSGFYIIYNGGGGEGVSENKFNFMALV